MSFRGSDAGSWSRFNPFEPVKRSCLDAILDGMSRNHRRGQIEVNVD